MTVPSTPALRAGSGYSGSTREIRTAGASGSSDTGVSSSRPEVAGSEAVRVDGKGAEGERFVSVTSRMVLPASGTMTGRRGSGGTRSTSLERTKASVPSAARTA